MLSESVSKGILLKGGVEAAETSRFVDIFDKFFDILNVSNFGNAQRKRKPFQAPFQSSQDERLEVNVYMCIVSCNGSYQVLYHFLQWLEQEFLPYLDSWEDSVRYQGWFYCYSKEKNDAQLGNTARTKTDRYMTSKSLNLILLIYLFFCRIQLKLSFIL